MKDVKCLLFLFFLFGNFYPLFSGSDTEYSKASEYLDQRGEVYFCLYPTPYEITPLTGVISIDNVIGNKVFAYANKDEFKEFLAHNIYYEVVTPPGLSGPTPVMSDYSDPGNREWDTYPTYTGYINMMNQFETDYPDLVKIYKIGESVQGRDLLIAKVSDNVAVKESEPEWLVCGGIHGDETAAIIFSLRLIDYLCTSYEKDERAHRILDSMEMWISPMANPDGTYKGGNNSVFGAGRYNANGTDLNRNYPRLPGVGGQQSPEAETVAFMDFGKEHNFVMNIDWHGGIEGIIYPYNSISTTTPDHTWWELVCRLYADLAQENSPPGYFTDFNNGICHGYSDLNYISKGTTKDYFYYYTHTRGVALEVSSTKILAESNLNTYWDYNIDAMLAYLQEILNGIRGNVTDSLTGEGLKAKIFVENHDKDSSWVYSDLPHGNYYRPIIQGTYDVTFSSNGCISKTISDVSVQNYEATILNVKLWDGTTGTDVVQKNTYSPISIVPYNRGVKIDFVNAEGIVRIYNMEGRIIKSLFYNGRPMTIKGDQLSTGLYFVELLSSKKRMLRKRINIIK